MSDVNESDKAPVDRAAQLRYARVLVARGRYGEFLRRAVVAARAEINRLLGRSEEQAYRRWLAELERDATPRWSPPAHDAPLVSLLLPAGREDRVLFTLASLRRQSYGEWELLVDEARGFPPDDRVRTVPGGLDEKLRAARGRMVAMVMPGDALLPRALEVTLQALHDHPDAPFCYTDEGLLDAGGEALRPRFKPDWSPDLLLELPYTSQLSLFRRDVVDARGGFARELSPMAALHDLTLRLGEQDGTPLHVAKLMYQRRLLPPAAASHEWADVAQAALLRRGITGTAEPGAAGRNSVAVRRTLASHPRVAIVIPFKNRVDLLSRCVASIRERSSYDRYEIVAIDNGSDDPATLQYRDELERAHAARFLDYREPFNFAAINNLAARTLDAELLLLLNNDTEIQTPDFIEALVEHAQRPEVGMVGARLTYPDGRLQHAGVVLGFGGLAGHPFDGWPDGGTDALRAVGHGGEVRCVRNVSVVTAACAMIRRELYLEMGGMDAVQFPVAFNDVDLCLKLRARGLLVIYTPHCHVVHHTSATRDTAPNLTVDEHLRNRWAAALAADPYYNQNLSLTALYRPRYCERIL